MHVQGTALYALQSCMNHSNRPNAEMMKEDSDMDGKAVISAQADIREGDEVVISYVDISASESEQRSVLRDYGIVL
jgi:SET domain-containing protein